MRIPGIPWRSRARTQAPPVAPWHGPAQDTRDANAASIEAIPLDILPDGPARRLLLAEAATGRDVYAYQATPHHTNRWYIWYGPLARIPPRLDGRVPAHVWAAQWDVILLAIATGAPVPPEITQAINAAPRQERGE